MVRGQACRGNRFVRGQAGRAIGWSGDRLVRGQVGKGTD